jgi:hypothetical protein
MDRIKREFNKKKISRLYFNVVKKIKQKHTLLYRQRTIACILFYTWNLQNNDI